MGEEIFAINVADRINVLMVSHHTVIDLNASVIEIYTDFFQPQTFHISVSSYGDKNGFGAEGNRSALGSLDDDLPFAAQILRAFNRGLKMKGHALFTQNIHHQIR